LKVQAFIGLGANLGDPQAQVRSAVAEIARFPRTRLLASSSLYRSVPVGVGPQPDFVNAVAKVETALSARELLEELLTAEVRFGRERPSPGAPRTLDLDLLLYGDAVIAEPGLVVPHPRMHERAFVLLPLAEIAAEVTIPGRGNIRALLAACRGQKIEKIGAP
jgi:2-amino-4-hydroxy-6-hydroxymethyldihydropteridine diphosphokinase